LDGWNILYRSKLKAPEEIGVKGGRRYIWYSIRRGSRSRKVRWCCLPVSLWVSAWPNASVSTSSTVDAQTRTHKQLKTGVRGLGWYIVIGTGIWWIRWTVDCGLWTVVRVDDGWYPLQLISACEWGFLACRVKKNNYEISIIYGLRWSRFVFGVQACRRIFVLCCVGSPGDLSRVMRDVSSIKHPSSQKKISPSVLKPRLCAPAKV